MLVMEHAVMAAHEMDPDCECTLIKPGKVIPDITDGERWLHITAEDGSASGWIDIGNLKDYIIDFEI